MAEHMRVLIDPKWKTQKEATLAKLKGSTTANDDEVAANVLADPAGHLGTTDEEVSNAVAESIEARKQDPPRGGGPRRRRSRRARAASRISEGAASAAKAAPRDAPAPGAGARVPAPRPGTRPACRSGPAPAAPPAAAPPPARRARAPRPAHAGGRGGGAEKRKIGERSCWKNRISARPRRRRGPRAMSLRGDEHMNGQTLDWPGRSTPFPVKKLVKDALGAWRRTNRKSAPRGSVS